MREEIINSQSNKQTMETTIDTKKFFAITYQTKDNRIEKYLVRSGVKRWKDQKGNQQEVQGTGSAAPEGLIRLYAANRKGYRSFLLERIIRVKQGNKILSSLNF